MKIAPLRAERMRGIVFLIASVMCFGLVDGFSKILIETQSLGQIVLARYVIAILGLFAATAPRSWKNLFQTQLAGLQIIRGLTPVMVGGPMVFAVKYLPLAEATAILFAGPFIVVAFSGWLLGERVSVSSWIGVALGFLGVLIVARPGFSVLSLYALFPAFAAVFYAILQLLSRYLGTAGEPPTTTLAWTLLVGTFVAVPLSIADWQPVLPVAWILSFALGATFGAGQYFLIKAFALASANVLTPFSYFQILSAALFGLIVFKDIPDVWTIAGITLILASGIYVLGRSQEDEN